MPLPLLLGPAVLLFLTTILPPLIWATIRAIGLTLVTYIGLDASITSLQTYIFTTANGLPSELTAIFGIAGIDLGIKIIISSYVTAYSIKQSIGGIKRLIFKS